MTWPNTLRSGPSRGHQGFSFDPEPQEPALSLEVSGGSEFTVSLPHLFLSQTFLHLAFSVSLPLHL